MVISQNGHPLQPGDVVWMPWQVARLFPALDVVAVIRPGSDGGSATLPTADDRRIAVRLSLVQPVGAGPVVAGALVRLLWIVRRVFEETATVLLSRDGMEWAPGPHARVFPVSLTAGAAASELVFVPVDQVRAPTRSPRPFTFEGSALALDPEMLPYAFEPVAVGAQPPPLQAPVVTSLVPSQAQLGTADFTLRVLGSGFDASAVILWNGSPEPTTFVSSTEVTTGVNMATAEAAISLPVAVETLGGVSNAVPFTFTPAAVRLAADPVGDPVACG